MCNYIILYNLYKIIVTHLESAFDDPYEYIFLMEKYFSLAEKVFKVPIVYIDIFVS